MDWLLTMIEIILSVNLFICHLKLEYFHLVSFQTLLTVTVKDVNDHDPIFTEKKYNFNVSENDGDGKTSVNVSVGQVIAKDEDKQSSILYRIVTSDVENLFDVTQVSFLSYIYLLYHDFIYLYLYNKPVFEYLNFACRITNLHRYLESFFFFAFAFK